MTDIACQRLDRILRDARHQTTTSSSSSVEEMEYERMEPQQWALHSFLAQHQSLEAIEEILPGLLREYGNHDDIMASYYVSPLHTAVYCNSFYLHRIVQLILTAMPHAASHTMRGCGRVCPLHVLCGLNRTIDSRVFDLLLAAHPQAVLDEDLNGDNAVSLLWKNVLRFRWAVEAEHGVDNSNSLAECQYEANDSFFLTIISPQQYMEMSIAMIQASKRRFHSCYSDSAEMSFEDICSFPRCPPLLLRLAMSSHFCAQYHIYGNPFMKNDQGCYPLHLACQASAISHLFLPDYAKGHLISTVVEWLLREYAPAASEVDKSGRLPLHYALQTTSAAHIRSIYGLIVRFPESLRIPDPNTGLYPFMAVAQRSRLVTDVQKSQRDMDSLTANLSYFCLGLCPEAPSLARHVEVSQ